MTPQVIILIAAMSLSAIGGGKVVSLYYESEISAIRESLAIAGQEAQKRNRTIELMGLELAGAVSERDAARHQKTRIVERTVVRKVVEYVQNPDIPRCDLHAEWVRVHDAAASSRVPENAPAASRPDDSAGRVTDADALLTVTENYATCHGIRNQLISLQEWAAGIQGLQ